MFNAFNTFVRIYSNLRIYRVDSFVKDEEHLHNWSLIDLKFNLMEQRAKEPVVTFMAFVLSL